METIYAEHRLALTWESNMASNRQIVTELFIKIEDLEPGGYRTSADISELTGLSKDQSSVAAGHLVALDVLEVVKPLNGLYQYRLRRHNDEEAAYNFFVTQAPVCTMPWHNSEPGVVKLKRMLGR